MSVDPGPLNMHVNAIQVGAVTAGYARFELDIPIITADAHAYHVNVPLSGSTESRCGDQEPVNSTPQRAEVFMPDRPADIRWSGDCGRFWLMIPRHTLQVETERLLGARPPGQSSSRPEWTSRPHWDVAGSTPWS
jgi:hypothetical protein